MEMVSVADLRVEEHVYLIDFLKAEQVARGKTFVTPQLLAYAEHQRAAAGVAAAAGGGAAAAGDGAAEAGGGGGGGE